mmetsp:Transcript_71134/g.169825  ORF Transcript_71134/g.169825 Transcript_71134/m.169825 type:complete len:260 (+) Transcript_71134:40-819(+)
MAALGRSWPSPLPGPRGFGPGRWDAGPGWNLREARESPFARAPLSQKGAQDSRRDACASELRKPSNDFTREAAEKSVHAGGIAGGELSQLRMERFWASPTKDAGEAECQGLRAGALDDESRGTTVPSSAASLQDVLPDTEEADKLLQDLEREHGIEGALRHRLAVLEAEIRECREEEQAIRSSSAQQSPTLAQDALQQAERLQSDLNALCQRVEIYQSENGQLQEELSTVEARETELALELWQLQCRLEGVPPEMLRYQ